MKNAIPPDLPPLPGFDTFAQAPCRDHARRAASSVCRSCLAPCCSECATKSEGVNLCAACLVRRTATLTQSPGARQVLAAQRAATTGGALATPARMLLALALYSLAAILAASYGVAMPFFENERRLDENKDRLAEVQLAVTAYFDDNGSYPPPERGLDALLHSTDDDRATWRGPYVTSRSTSGRGVAAAGATKDAVLDVFGHPVLYYARPAEDDPETMAIVYIASPGANGVWDTAGVESGNPAHEASGDDVLKWIVW